MICGQPDQYQVFQPESPNDDAPRSGGDSLFAPPRLGVAADPRPAFEHGPPQPFDFGARKHGEARLGAPAPARPGLRVHDLEDAMPKPLLAPGLPNAYSRHEASLR